MSVDSFLLQRELTAVFLYIAWAILYKMTQWVSPTVCASVIMIS